MEWIGLDGVGERVVGLAFALVVKGIGGFGKWYGSFVMPVIKDRCSGQ